MAQSLQAGGNLSIGSFSGTITVSHDIDPRHDINLTAFLLTESGIVQGDSGIVFFNQPIDPDGAATFISPVESANTKTHRIDFDLRKMPSGISKIAVTLSEENQNSFSSVRNLKAEVRSGSDIVQLNPSSFNTENGIIVLELYVRNNQAKVKSIWQGFTSGLDAICNHYGVNVAGNHTDSSVSPPTNLSGSSSNNSSNSFNNPNGKVYQVYGESMPSRGGIRKIFGIVFIILSSIWVLGSIVATFQKLMENITNSIPFKESVSNLIVGLIITLVFSLPMLLGIFMVRSGNKAAREAARDAEGKNPNYVIDSTQNAFFLPNENEPLCKLSDISAVNKRTDTERNRVRRTEYVNGKRKERYRTEIERTYYVQIIGANISQEFEFSEYEQSNRDALYSSLKAGIKEVNDFIRRNYF